MTVIHFTDFKVRVFFVTLQWFPTFIRIVFEADDVKKALLFPKKPYLCNKKSAAQHEGLSSYLSGLVVLVELFFFYTPFSRYSAEMNFQ